MEEEAYIWTEVKLPSLRREPELERETGERRRGRDIIIAIDHGPNSKHAFDWAIVHLCRLADTIHLVHTVTSTSMYIIVLAFLMYFADLCRIFVLFLFSWLLDLFWLGLKNEIVYVATQALMEKLALEAMEVAMVIKLNSSFKKIEAQFFHFLYFFLIFIFNSSLWYALLPFNSE